MPLRILHATPSYAPAYTKGGPVVSLEGLIGALRGLDVDVRVLTTDDGIDVGAVRTDAWTLRDGTPVRYLHAWRAPDLTPAYAPAALLAARDADVVHVTGVFTLPSVQALAAARLARRPSVLSPRGALEPGSLAVGSVRAKRRWLAAFRALFERVAIFHATAESEASSIRAVFPGARVRVVPNGAPLGAPRERASDRPVIATLGRVHPNKGHDRLVEALGVLKGRGVAATLAIAGPIEDRAFADRVVARAAELGVADAVAFVGEVRGEAKAAHLRRARVLALPSRGTENFGNAVVEALAEGTPVVASRATPWQTLPDERCGAWVDAEPAALADALGRYLVDATAALEDGRRGQALVASRYGWPGIARRMLAAYEEAASCS